MIELNMKYDGGGVVDQEHTEKLEPFHICKH